MRMSSLIRTIALSIFLTLATPAAAQSCVAGPYMVFFDRDSDTVTPQAAAILDNAASNYASCGGSPVLLQGHTETAGASKSNVGLSQRRVLNVRSYLAARGISDSVITSEAFGESRPLVETNDGVREPQNNRVEITYGPEASFDGAPGSTVHTDSAAGNNLRPPSGPGPIMEEPWNGVGKPPTSPPSESTAALADFRKTCGNSKGSEMLPHYENVFLERRSLKHGPEQWRKELPETVPGIYQCMLQVLLRHRINGVPGFGAGSIRGATRRSKERPVPHLSDDQKIFNEMLRQQREGSSTMSEADARFAAETLEYEQKLAAQQKAVAEYEAAQRQVEADKAAAAAKARAAQEDFARQQAAYQAEQDRYARERAEYEAQLAGGPVAAQGAGTLAPLSTGGPQAKSVQEGEDARIIASDGKPAMDCVKLIQLTETDSGMGGGGRVLSNQCSDEVEIGWCYTPGDCETETGSSWTVQPGNSWPVSAEKQIRWVACHGKNTASFVKGSYGLRYICKAPTN